MKITLLGCGSSGGVPLIGCNCKTCRSNDPKNKRSRVSVLIETNGLNLLIDTSPDLREQALKNNITRVDAVLYTHDHADHTHGLDDLRSFNYLSGGPIPVYGDAPTIALLKQRFAYAFLGKPENVWFRPALTAHILPAGAVQTFTIGGASITLFEQIHGKVKTLGYRIGNFAYSTDVDHLPEPALEALAGIDTWIVDCLRYTESHSHADLRLTLEWVKKVRPKRAILTHMAHEFEYNQLKSELPQGVVPGYDSMVIEL